MFNDQPRVRATVLAKPTPTTLVVQLAGDVQVTIDGVAPVGTSIDVYADDVVQRGNGYELVNFTGYRLTHPGSSVSPIAPSASSPWRSRSRPRP